MLGLALALSPGNSAIAVAAETAAFIARMGTQPNATYAAAIDELIRGLIADGTWGKLDYLRVYALHNATDALLNWKGVSYTGTPVNSPTWSISGYAGDGATSYINSNFNPGAGGLNFTQNNNTLFAFLATGADGTSRRAVGNTDNDLNPRTSGNSASARSSSTTSNIGPGTVMVGNGLIATSRASSGGYDLYLGGTVYMSPTQASSALASVNLFELARNNAGTPADLAAFTLMAAGAGASLTADQMASLNTRLQTYKARVGA